MNIISKLDDYLGGIWPVGTDFEGEIFDEDTMVDIDFELHRIIPRLESHIKDKMRNER